MANTVILTSNRSLFKGNKRENFSKDKCEFMKFLLGLLDKIKILTFKLFICPANFYICFS